MDYVITLDKFQGPLDLLLHLIEKAKVDIKDIFISQITEQYLQYISDMGVDMEHSSGFLDMATTLVYIKSRMLLPKTDDTDENEPGQSLIMQLEQYKRFKELSGRLRRLEEAATNTFYKLPEEFPFPPREISIAGADIKLLYAAFVKAVSTVKDEAMPVEIYMDSFTVQGQRIFISDILKKQRRVTFLELFRHEPSRVEFACTFVALLDMLSSRQIKVRQSSAFGNIIISLMETA